MRVSRGGLLASTGAAALCSARFAMFGRVPDGDQGGGGGASGLLDDDDGGAAAAAAAAAAASSADDGGAAAAAAAAAASSGDALTVADWMKGYSGEKAGDELSHQEWLAKKGFADPDAVIASYRAAEKSIRESGKVKIPGDGASDAEIAAFREAIGAPKEADGYKVTMPEGAENYEIDSAFLDPMKAAAHKHGISAAAFEELGSIFMAQQLEDAKAEANARDVEAAAKVKEWGTEAPQKKEEFKRGATLLGLKKSDIAKIEEGFGAGATLELFAKLGAMTGEDFFAEGNPQQRFGLGSLDEAEKQLNAMIDDPEIAARLRSGADKTLKAKYDRLTDAVAAFRQQQKGKR